jgi:hypothetical protein
MKKIILLLLFCFSGFIYAQETPDVNIEENHSKEKSHENSYENKKPVTGIIFSFSGFNEYRMGMGVFFGKLGTDGGGIHPLGSDFGLLFEYNFKDNITYNRFYYHLTGGVSATLLGGSMVIASNKDAISVGFAPEVGAGLSTVFKLFYRYNFYLNKKFNSYEVVFHICLYPKQFEGLK